MWSTFDDSNYPKINVNLNGIIKKNEEFHYFINKWDSYNNRKTPYIFIFDCIDVGMVSIKYSILMSNFIKKLKRKEQYLKSSIIIVKHDYTVFLLKVIFFFQKPVANVYITHNSNPEFINNLYEDIMNNKNIDLDNDDLTLVKASKKLINVKQN